MTTGLLTRLCETMGWKQFVFPSRFTWEGHPAAGPCPSRPLPAGSPAHNRTLSPLNDKQLRDAEAVKCIRQVQGSLPNRCGHGSVLRGHAHSWGEYTQNTDNGLGGSRRAGGGGGCSALSPLARGSSFPALPLHRHGLQLHWDRSFCRQARYSRADTLPWAARGTGKCLPTPKPIEKETSNRETGLGRCLYGEEGGNPFKLNAETSCTCQRVHSRQVCSLCQKRRLH